MRDLEEGATFLRKWGLLGLLIGAGTGVGALCLIWLIQLFNRYFLEIIVGYVAPAPGGEGGQERYIFHTTRLWLLPAVTTVIGLKKKKKTKKQTPKTTKNNTKTTKKAFHT